MRLARLHTKRRRGAILILCVFFIMIIILMTGFLVDLSRVQLAKSQLYAIADAVALAAVSNLEKWTLGYDEGIHLILGDSNDKHGCWYRINPPGDFWLWNSIFPDSNGELYPQGVRQGSRPTASCVSVHDIIKVYERLNLDPQILSSIQFAEFTHSEMYPYAFDPSTVSIDLDMNNSRLHTTGLDPVHLSLVATAEVPMIFGRFFKINSSTIEVRVESSLQMY